MWHRWVCHVSNGGVIWAYVLAWLFCCRYGQSAYIVNVNIIRARMHSSTVVFSPQHGYVTCDAWSCNLGVQLLCYTIHYEHTRNRASSSHQIIVLNQSFCASAPFPYYLSASYRSIEMMPVSMPSWNSSLVANGSSLANQMVQRIVISRRINKLVEDTPKERLLQDTSRMSRMHEGRGLNTLAIKRKPCIEVWSAWTECRRASTRNNSRGDPLL